MSTAQASSLLTGPVPPGSLRAEMEARRAAGRAFSLREATSILVPVCTQLATLHGAGQRFFVHPSALRWTPGGGAEVAPDRAHRQPEHPRDRACLAREERGGHEGDERASVFAVGAMLYELLTGQSVGPAMRRPTELVPGLPPAVELLLGKALVADPTHRPHDLHALAQALHNLAPTASAPPPAADESHLDHDADFEVDVSLSMLPPAPSAAGVPSSLRLAAVRIDGPYSVAIREAQGPASSADPTKRLADLKAALESDPRPRYVVIKDGMDHGPFSAVELLQQIASASFLSHHALRDVLGGEERQIKDWEQFAPFADQAKLNRDIVVEKKNLEAVVAAESKTTRTKAVVASTVVGVLVVAIGGSFAYRGYQRRQAELEAQAQRSDQIVSDGSLAAASSAKGHAGRPGGVGGPRPSGGGNYPILSGSMSCEAAQARYVEEYKMGNETPPDLTAGAYGAVLNRGGYLNSCGVPSNMEVNICAAVQNGRAVGVTVTTSPSNAGIASCVAQQVRGLPFPSHPRLDVARTTFAAN